MPSDDKVSMIAPQAAHYQPPYLEFSWIVAYMLNCHFGVVEQNTVLRVAYLSVNVRAIIR